jgi:hypothetical protein
MQEAHRTRRSNVRGLKTLGSMPRVTGAVCPCNPEDIFGKMMIYGRGESAVRFAHGTGWEADDRAR